jgi:PPM family protein phosphatase
MSGESNSGFHEELSCLLALEEFRPAASSTRVDIGARSHQGAVRSSNEDHYLVMRLERHQDTVMTSLPRGDLPTRFDERGFVMLVADGLGETGGGAVASRVALSALAHLAIHFGKWNLRIDPLIASEIKERAGWFYRRAEEAVTARARAHPVLAGMATTLTAAYSAGDHLFTAHVGHSRAYLVRKGTITQLTPDHTVAWHRANTGGMTDVGRGMQDLQHILTDTIGGNDESPLVDIGHVRLLDGDAVLLCTNGLTDVLGDDRIADVLTFRRTSREQCRLLVDLALRGGVEDNVTTVIAQYQIPNR